ncbi:dinitrogenase iron-molybdenum cofactor biosynthesis protein [candidate division GN15 bacterium]|nr:dinitrogenase iron-molybdenum cofactor biosynthesis protein [candidate division GN15 bacterium]
MKIAVSSTGPELTHAVEPRFGRTPYLIIRDTTTGETEVVSNSTNAASAQGAGIRTAELVVRHGAEIVVSGNIGPKAFAALEQAGVLAMICAHGTVEEAIELACNDQLVVRSQADVPGHAGKPGR